MTIKNMLKILFIEDLPSDVDLAILEMRKEKLTFEHKIVCTREDLIKALQDFKPDLIISDYMMPAFNGLQALMVVKEFDTEIPFILCTGSVNEETAVECIKAGARDYIIKEHLTRLPFAVKEALDHVRIQKEKRASELLLKDSEEKLQSIFSVAPIGLGLVVDRVFIEVNDFLCQMTGYERNDLIGKTSEILYPSREEFERVGKEKYQQIADKGTGSVETLFKCKDNKILNIILSSTPLDICDHSKGVTFTALDITESKKNEQALRESEDRFRALYNDAVAGLYRTNSDGEILLANNTLVKMLGFSSFEELSSINLNKYGAGNTYQRQNFIDQIEKEGEVRDLEAIWICRDGKEIFVRETAKAIRDSDGVILFYDGTVEDITERKIIEKALEESHRTINTLIGNLQGMVYRCRNDKSWTMEFLSEGARELIGYAPADLLNNNKISFVDIIYADDLEQVQNEVKESLERKNHFEITYRIIDSNGNLKWVWEKGVGIFSGDNELSHIEGFITDITQRKNVEEALSESQQLFETLAKSAPVGIFRTDLDGHTTYVNPKWAELSGLSFEEAVGNGWLNAIHPEDRRKLSETWINDFKTKKESYAEYRFLKPDGSIVWVIGKAVPEWIDNKILGYVGTITDITERKKTEKALQESEEKFRSIAENLSDIIFILDTEGVIKYISPASKSLGYSTEESLGKFFDVFLADGEYVKAMQFFNNALNSIHISNVVNLIFKRKDGSNFYAELSGSVFNIGNENKGILGLLRDVSDKVYREEELRKLSLAVEQNPASIVITNTDGKIEYVNPKLCDITGYSKDELIGRNPGILSSGEKSKEEYLDLWNTILAGNEWKGEFHNKKKNGELYWEAAAISPIKNEKGEITHFLGTNEDITDKKIMEAAVVENEQRYRELFLNTPAPTYIFDTESLEFIEVNDATVISYGYSREEFASMTLKDLREQEDIPFLIESVRKLGKGTYHSTDIRHRKKDGTIFPVEIFSHHLPEKNGRKTRLVVATDITERVKASEQMKLAKEKAEASDKLKTTFLNNISHEVRTPLNGILGFAEIMSQIDLSDEEKKDSLLMLHESSDRLLNTITNYMDISLIASGNLSVNKKDFLPYQVLRIIFDDYQKICSTKKLELVLKIPEHSEDLIINSDPEIFHKILTHLLNNAIKFTEKGIISFGYSIIGKVIEFFVKDTGVGIGNESHNIVFDNFVKEDRGPLMITEGSGLGLSIAKGMTDIIGGIIRVESQLGVGSCFYFTVPLMKDYELITSGASVRENKKNIGGASILVAEDDETNFFYLNALLTHETGATVYHASNGREAIELFKLNSDIQLILMDIKMPVVDGLEATRQIKLIKKEVPIIAITAYAMAGDELRVLAAGCDGYLSKPISKKRLLEKMAEFVKV